MRDHCASLVLSCWIKVLRGLTSNEHVPTWHSRELSRAASPSHRQSLMRALHLDHRRRSTCIQGIEESGLGTATVVLHSETTTCGESVMNPPHWQRQQNVNVPMPVLSKHSCKHSICWALPGSWHLHTRDWGTTVMADDGKSSCGMSTVQYTSDGGCARKQTSSRAASICIIHNPDR